MPKPANLLLATLRARLKMERDPLERAVLRDRIKSMVANRARLEFEDKARDVRRELAGAY